MFKNLTKELREFILRGNVIDMAIGIIIGAAFGKVVDSFVKDIIMPPIGLLLGKVDFSNLYLQIYPHNIHYSTFEAAKNAGAVTINYGIFFNNIISFLIVGCSVFLMIKSINTLKNKMKKEKQEENVATQKECPFCHTQIPIQAIRCPNCTSELKNEPENN